MNYLDILIAIPLIYGLYKGYKRGFVMEIFVVLALVIGLYVAFLFSDQVVRYSVDITQQQPSYLPSLIFVIVFLAVGIGVYAIGKLLEKVIKISLLSFPNRIAGLALGFLKLLYICGTVLVFLSSFQTASKLLPEDTLKNSILFPIATTFVTNTIPGVTNTVVYTYHTHNAP